MTSYAASCKFPVTYLGQMTLCNTVTRHRTLFWTAVSTFPAHAPVAGLSSRDEHPEASFYPAREHHRLKRRFERPVLRPVSVFVRLLPTGRVTKCALIMLALALHKTQTTRGAAKHSTAAGGKDLLTERPTPKISGTRSSTSSELSGITRGW